MEYPDANNNPIKQGFYVETFYKGKDEFRNRIAYIGEKDTRSQRPLSIMNRANIAPLNGNYSRMAKAF